MSFVQDLQVISFRIYRLSSQEITSLSATLDGVKLQDGFDESELSFDTMIIPVAWIWKKERFESSNSVMCSLTIAKHILEIQLTFNDEQGYHAFKQQYIIDLQSPHLQLSKRKQDAIRLFTVIEPIVPKVILCSCLILVCLLLFIHPPTQKQTQVLNTNHFSFNVPFPHYIHNRFCFV